MRRAAHLDNNQKEIVAELKKRGASVLSLASIGKGCPDILVGFQGRNYLFEIKNEAAGKYRAKAKPDQVAWHDSWRGWVFVAMNLTHIMQEIGMS